MHRLLAAIAAFVMISCEASVGSTLPAGGERVRQAFSLHIPSPPTIAQVDGASRLAYELHLTNFARVPLTITAVEVVDDTAGKVVLRIGGSELAAAVGGPGVGGTGEARRTVETGRLAVVYLDHALSSTPPERLRHRVEFDVHAIAGRESATIVGAVAPVSSVPLPILSPPLSGGPWAAIYDPALESGHRRYLYAVGGQARIPGRFAIDWMWAGPLADGGTKANRITGAGAPVLAVADAVVVATRDDVPELAPGAPRSPLTLADATGNYVALDLGGGRYAFYEHLAPGLLVRSGERVRRGQVIARLGSTGQASRPHLHFHVADANSPLAAEGQPYRLEGYRTLGSYDSIAAFEGGVPWRPNPVMRDGPALPGPNAVVMFNDLGSGRLR